MSDAAPGLGHNLPPLQEQLADETTELVQRRDELVGSADRAPPTITDELIATKVADLVRLIAACIKNAEAARVSRKEPYLAAGRLVDAHYKNNITGPLETVKRDLERRLTLYQRQKAEEERRAREAEARRQAEEAERQRREAEAAAEAAATDADLDAAISAEELARQAEADAVRAKREAEAKPADLSRSRGDLGAVASLHTFWDWKDLDRDTIDLDALRPHFPADAIEKAVRSYIRAGGRKLTGVTIFENTETRVR